MANFYNIPPRLLKGRTGNHVIYDIDYLLDNLEREISLLTEARRHKAKLDTLFPTKEVTLNNLERVFGKIEEAADEDSNETNDISPANINI